TGFSGTTSPRSATGARRSRPSTRRRGSTRTTGPISRGLAVLRVDPLANPEPLIRRVYAYVAYRIGDGPDAEDITSETFERALRYRHSYDASKGEPAAWLIGIARRCLAGVPPPPPAATPVEETPAAQDVEEESARRVDLQA